jgi:hypothetical protein
MARSEECSNFFADRLGYANPCQVMLYQGGTEIELSLVYSENDVSKEFSAGRSSVANFSGYYRDLAF